MQALRPTPSTSEIDFEASSFLKSRDCATLPSTRVSPRRVSRPSLKTGA